MNERLGLFLHAAIPPYFWYERAKSRVIRLLSNWIRHSRRLHSSWPSIPVVVRPTTCAVVTSLAAIATRPATSHVTSAPWRAPQPWRWRWPPPSWPSPTRPRAAAGLGCLRASQSALAHAQGWGLFHQACRGALFWMFLGVWMFVLDRLDEKSVHTPC